MVRSEDKVELISTLRSSSGNFQRRSRNGIIFVALAFFVVVSVLFYICSIDYETLTIERKLLRYHEALNKKQQEELKRHVEDLASSSSDGKKKLLLGQDTHDLEDHEEGHASYESRVRAAFEHSNTESSFKLTGSNDVIVMIQIQNSGSSNLERRILKDIEGADCNCEKRRCKCIRPKEEEDKQDSPEENEGDNHEEDDDDDNDDDKKLHPPSNNSPNWLFSRRTVGWPCGIHAGWTEMTSCVDSHLDSIEGYAFKRRYFYTTQLRHPIRRFLSEYFRSQTFFRSNTSESRMCRGQPVVIPSCNFTTPSLTSLSDYIKCPVNLAVNRQTRMLADLSLVNCYNQTGMSKKEYDFILLSSAKANLHKMAFFALDEFPQVSSQLFSDTFGVKFTEKSRQESSSAVDSMSRNKKDKRSQYRHLQLKRSVTLRGSEESDIMSHQNVNKKKEILENKRRKHYLLNDLPQELVDQVKEANRLDMELYEYAKELLFDRFHRRQAMKQQINRRDPVKNTPVTDDGEEGFDIEEGDEDDDDDDKVRKKNRAAHLLTNKLLRALNLSAIESLILSN